MFVLFVLDLSEEGRKELWRLIGDDSVILEILSFIDEEYIIVDGCGSLEDVFKTFKEAYGEYLMCDFPGSFEDFEEVIRKGFVVFVSWFGEPKSL